MHDKSVFSSQELDEQLHEYVEHIGFIAIVILSFWDVYGLHISDSVEKEGFLRDEYGKPGRSRVNLTLEMV